MAESLGGQGMANSYRVAVIAGDGIGREVVPEGIAVMEAAARRYGFALEWREFDWSCETYAKTGHMMPADGIVQLSPYDAVFLGAVGHPGVPDHVSLWGLLIPLRRSFQQYINLRPGRREYPATRPDESHLTLGLPLSVRPPDGFAVVVGSILFGDIRSDLGPACVGSIGIAPSGNINPERESPSMFEPVHGSAPDIAGQGIANPIGQIWSGAMMLKHFREPPPAQTAHR